MLIDSSQRPWIVGTSAATVVAAVGYGIYVSTTPYGPSGGSWTGLTFGILGTSAMVTAGLLAARKKVRTMRLGSARLWLQLHVWLGLLAVPLILFHAGFRLGGTLTTLLMLLFGLVTLSGIFGLVLQQFLPAMMTARVPLETIHSQIDHVCDKLAADAYELVATVTGPLPEAEEERSEIAREEEEQKARPSNWKYVSRQRPADEPASEAELLRSFYVETLRPYLRRDRRTVAPPPDFRPLLTRAPEEWRPTVERLRSISEESRQLALQERLHAWLHNWLFVHAPLSFALFVLTAFHIVFALRY